MHGQGDVQSEGYSGAGPSCAPRSIEAKRGDSLVVFTEDLRSKREAIAPARERGRPKESEHKPGNTRIYQKDSEDAVARLKRDRPDLAEKVVAGEVSPNCGPIIG